MNDTGCLHKTGGAQYPCPATSRRASGGIPRPIYLCFLTIANGSLYELQTQVEIALNLGYMERTLYDTLHEQTREIERMMSSLIQSLKRRNH